MKFKTALFGATALGMLMATGAVYAGDNNDSRTWQVGSGNNSNTDQSNAHDSTVGAPGNLAGQIGDGNYLTITQVAGHNSAGTSGDGIDQQQNYGYINVTQGVGLNYGYNPDNSLVELHQGGYSGANPGFYVNQAYVSQFYNDTIDSINQTFTGSSTDGRNYVSITQQGTIASGDHVGSVVQSGHDNTFILNMTNSGGFSANGVGGFTAGDIASIVADPGAYGAPSGLIPGSFVPVTQGGSLQTGANNSANFTIDGNGNLFGFEQTGQGGNSITGGIVGGTADEIALVQLQQGAGTNSVNANMSGGFNKLGVFQVGGDNFGSANIDGTQNNQGALVQVGLGGSNQGSVTTGATSNDNIVAVLQYASGGSNNGSASSNGSFNTVGVIQYATGGSNTGNVSVTSGTGNAEVIGQYSTSGSNNANVTITGSNNNALQAGPAPAAFASGRAAKDIGNYFANHINTEVAALGGGSVLTDTLGALGTDIGNLSLSTPGLSTQFADAGGSNGLGLTVTGDSNLFSTTQSASGGSNSLTASINGNGNELAVQQLTNGGSNSATTTQNGYGNSIGLTQVGSNSANITQ